MEAISSQCTCFCPKSRPKVCEVVQLFQDAKVKSPCHDIPLSTSQSTAIEHHDKLVAVGVTPLDQEIADDATNNCAFLSILIADLIALKASDANSPFDADQWNVLSSVIDKIILAQPKRFNPVRDVTRLYDVSEAYDILCKANILSRELEFREKLITSHGVFSKDGRDALLKVVHALSSASSVINVANYRCGR